MKDDAAELLRGMREQMRLLEGCEPNEPPGYTYEMIDRFGPYEIKGGFTKKAPDDGFNA